MSCLVHHPRFRSSFHNIINDLRSENRMPITVLRNMPKQCCTCKNEDSNQDDLMMKENEEFEKMKTLMQRINLEKSPNTKLVLSLNRLTSLIEQNRLPAPGLPKTLPEQKERRQSSSSSASSSSTRSEKKEASKRRVIRSSSEDSSSSSDADEDVIPMDVTTTPVRSGRQQRGKMQKSQKPPKPIKNGTFIFLPYLLINKTNWKSSDALLEVAKKLQRSRFFGRAGHIGALEKQYNARINMITPKTSKPVIEALENAKIGFENLKIHQDSNSIARSELQQGEWFLVRSKVAQNQTKTDDFEQLLDDLTTRWNNCLAIQKRTGDDADNVEGSPRKKK